MRKIILIATFVLIGFTQTFAGEIKYVGSSTIGKFVQDASSVYTKSTFSINTIPESDGGERVGIIGGADIGGVARDVKDSVIEAGGKVFLIGRDAIAVIVHNSNPVKSLTSAQLKGIFTGKIKNWKEVGGKDKPINPLITDKDSATHKIFWKIILGGEEYRAQIIRPDARIVTEVMTDEGAIGQISFAFLNGTKGIRPLTVDGHEPSVNNPSYSINRPLYLVTKGSPVGEVKEFIDWVLSPEGQKLVKKRFVGIK